MSYGHAGSTCLDGSVQQRLQRGQIEFGARVEAVATGLPVVRERWQQSLGGNGSAAPRRCRLVNDEMVAQVLEPVGVKSLRTWRDSPPFGAKNVEAKALGGAHVDGVGGESDVIPRGFGLTWFSGNNCWLGGGHDLRKCAQCRR